MEDLAHLAYHPKKKAKTSHSSSVDEKDSVDPLKLEPLFEGAGEWFRVLKPVIQRQVVSSHVCCLTNYVRLLSICTT